MLPPGSLTVTTPWMRATTSTARQPKLPNFDSTPSASTPAARFLSSRSHPTFFFYNMEWRRLVQGEFNQYQAVPVADTYGGNFYHWRFPADSKDPNGALVPHSGLHVPCAYQLSTAEPIVRAAGNHHGSSCAPDRRKNAMDCPRRQGVTVPAFIACRATRFPPALLDHQMLKRF